MTAVTKRQAPAAFDAQSVQADARVLAYAADQSTAGKTVHLRDVAKECDMSIGHASRIIGRLVKDGHLLAMAGQDGWVSASAFDVGASSPRTSLADLLELARGNTSSAAATRRGRQAMHASRDIESLTTGQLADAQRLVALVARCYPGADGDASAVAGATLSWDSSANQGRGGWALVELVREWAREEHRLKHEARQSRIPATHREHWNPRLADDTVRDNQGAANNLLHLAATHGLIARSPLNRGLASNIYAPCWTPVINRWSRWIGRRGGAANRRRTFIGCRTLAVYATKLGFQNVRTTDWLAVRRAMASDAATGALARWAHEAARYVWRIVYEALGSRLRLGAAFQWALVGDTPVSLVSAHAVAAAAVVDASMADRDFCGWTTMDGAYISGLIEGTYGIRRWAAWSTLNEMLLRRQAEPLPPRVWAFPSSIVDRRADQRPGMVAEDTLKTRLRFFNHLAGYAARERGVDWTTADGLLTLSDPDLVDAFVGWMILRPKDPRGDGRSQLTHIVRTMAWLTNSFLSGQAKLSGDDALVEQLRHRYHRLEAIAQEIPKPDHKDLRKVAAMVLATADGWKGTDGVDGIRKLSRLVDLLEAELIELAQGRSIGEQIATLTAGTWTPGPQWGKTLRLMIVLLVAQRVPLRGGTISRLKLAHWLVNPVGAAQQALDRAGLLKPWQGALSLGIPGPLMKSKRAFSPPLILPENVVTPDHDGSAPHEAAIRRDLLELWFCENGGRDVCRTTTDPLTGRSERLDVPWLFPDAIGDSYYAEAKEERPPAVTRARPARGRKRRNRRQPGIWTRGRLSAAFGRAVKRHADALGINLKALHQITGALGFHVVRRLFGSFWAPRNLLVTSRLLDHTKITLTATVYCAQDVRAMSLDVAATP